MELDGCFPVALRNLALSYYNKMGRRGGSESRDGAGLRSEPGGCAHFFLELDQLYKKLGVTAEERLANYGANQETFMKRDDAVIEYITLKNQLGRHQEAYELTMSRRFHPWEGGEGKITTQYTVALVELAKEAIGNGEPELAQELLNRALTYPENLGEGKLEGTKDNHIYYYMGCVKEALGFPEEARECFERASVGPDEPAGMMYYYDQPADMILYQGLAKLKLEKQGSQITVLPPDRLRRAAHRGITCALNISPCPASFLIFEDDLDVRNKGALLLPHGPWKFGAGNVQEAEQFFDQALEMDGNHLNAQARFYDVVTTGECHIVHPDFCKILVCTKEYFEEKKVGFYKKMQHTGYLRHLLVRRAVKTGEILVDLITTTQTDSFEGTEEALLRGWTERLQALPIEGSFAGILHTKNDTLADAVKDEGTDILFGREHFYEELLGLRFQISPFSFFQTNSLGAEVLYEKTREYVGETKGKVVFDLYRVHCSVAKKLSSRYIDSSKLCYENANIWLMQELTSEIPDSSNYALLVHKLIKK